MDVGCRVAPQSLPDVQRRKDSSSFCPFASGEAVQGAFPVKEPGTARDSRSYMLAFKYVLTRFIVCVINMGPLKGKHETQDTSAARQRKKSVDPVSRYCKPFYDSDY